MLSKLQKDLRSFTNPEKAKILGRFFKTGKGEYGEGDKFLGIILPLQRSIVRKYWKEITFEEMKELVKSPLHEERLVSLLIAVDKFEKGNKKERKEIYDFYLSHTKFINNWDLVDLTAPRIIGAYLHDKDKEILTMLAKSKSLWEKRISILSTFYFIRQGDPSETFRIARLLINDKHDLIHKAVGWMLREIGKRCGEKAEEKFLQKYYKTMPRTMLRYAIEKFDNKKRKYYLAK